MMATSGAAQLPCQLRHPPRRCRPFLLPPPRTTIFSEAASPTPCRPLGPHPHRLTRKHKQASGMTRPRPPLPATPRQLPPMPGLGPRTTFSHRRWPRLPCSRPSCSRRRRQLAPRRWRRTTSGAAGATLRPPRPRPPQMRFGVAPRHRRLRLRLHPRLQTTGSGVPLPRLPPRLRPLPWDPTTSGAAPHPQPQPRQHPCRRASLKWCKPPVVGTTFGVALVAVQQCRSKTRFGGIRCRRAGVSVRVFVRE